MLAIDERDAAIAARQRRRPRLGVLVWVATLTIAALAGYLLQRPEHSLETGSTTGPLTPLGELLLDPHSAVGRIAAAVAASLALGLSCWLIVAADDVGGLRGVTSPRARKMVAQGAVLATLALQPVRDSIARETPTLVLVSAVVAVSTRQNRRLAPLLGLAAALQPALLLFTVLIWSVDRRAVRRLSGSAPLTAITFVVATLAGALMRPRATSHYWLHRGWLGGSAAANDVDQSVRGMGYRLGLHGAQLDVAWVALSLAVTVVAAMRARRYADDGQRLLAIGIMGCAVVAVEPVSWTDALLWIGFAAAGRLGRRRQDRGVWPLVALIPLLLPGRVLDPHIDPVTSFLLLNSAGLLAIAVCTAVPFLRTAAPSWRVDWSGQDVLPAGRRAPLLPAFLRGIDRPNLLLELFVVQVGYGFYTWIRNVAPNRSALAISHGQGILDVERFLHIDVERALNRFALHYDWLEDALEHYYKTFHFAVPLAVLGWLYWRHPLGFRSARTALFLCTGLALIGFWAFPLAPPRLTPGHGFRDTLHPGADSDPFGAFTKLANQFAAMPSLHIGWSTWSAVVVMAIAPALWVRVLAGLYPVCTLFAILATANHWVLDAVGGLVTLAVAFGVQYLLTGRRLSDPEDPDNDVPAPVRQRYQPKPAGLTAKSPDAPPRESRSGGVTSPA